MDRAKAAVYLVGLFGVATVGQGVELASMAGFEPQLSLFFGSGLLMSGIAVRTVHQDSYEEFALFRRRDAAFWAVMIAVSVYVIAVSAQFL